jgi:hypothetical protein
MAGASTPVAIDDAAPPDRKPARRRGGWPAGKPRGRPPKAAVAAAEKRAAQAVRNAERKRQRRAAARAQRETAQQATADAGAVKPATASNGTANNGTGGKKGEAARLWAHAAKIDSKCPWRAVASEFELNRQATLDAYRLHALPPGVTVDAVERFLELPVE